MNRNKGFTLIELLIVIAIVAILVTVLAGLFGPRKAGAHEAAPSGIVAAMAEVGAQYVWSTDEHVLTIIDKGTAAWESAEDVCSVLEGKVDHAHVSLRTNNGTGELRWESTGEQRMLTNLPTTSTATCG